MNKEQTIEGLKQLIDELRADGCNKVADLMCEELAKEELASVKIAHHGNREESLKRLLQSVHLSLAKYKLMKELSL